MRYRNLKEFCFEMADTDAIHSIFFGAFWGECDSLLRKNIFYRLLPCIFTQPNK